MRSRAAIALLAAFGAAVAPLEAQQPQIIRPSGPVWQRPYKTPSAAPVRLTNSERMRQMIRAGTLYLTLQDAIALAIENNLDLEVDRYGPLGAEWDLERYRAGGALKGVQNGNTFTNQVTSGQGIAGAEQSAGLLTNSGGGSNGNTNTSIQQYTAVTPNLDPVFQNTDAWSHATQPQPNAAISQTPELINSEHLFQTFVQQGFLSGGFVQVTQNEEYLGQNSPNDLINPSVAPVLAITARHNFLDGFGVGLNSRFIRAAEKGVDAASESFRSQLLDTVANVATLYWGLAAADQDLAAREHARDIAQKFRDDTLKRISVGEIAGFERTRAEEELSVRTREVGIAQASVQQQEILLKDAISRDGLADPLLNAANVVPLDHLQVPASDELPSLRDMVKEALADRPDIALAKLNDETQQILAIGTQREVLPLLLGIASTRNQGVAGVANPNPPPGSTPNPATIGGMGTALGEIFSGDYNSRQGAVVFQAPFRNRVAQSDYGIDQLTLQQGNLLERRQLNQLVVDISNQAIALRQAHSRYTLASATRQFQEQLLEKTQQEFALGGSTVDDIVAAQRALATAQYSEVEALSSYSRAKVALDRVLGQTLKANHVSVDDALAGRASLEAAAAPPPAQPSR